MQRHIFCTFCFYFGHRVPFFCHPLQQHLTNCFLFVLISLCFNIRGAFSVAHMLKDKQLWTFLTPPPPPQCIRSPERLPLCTSGRRSDQRKKKKKKNPLTVESVCAQEKEDETSPAPQSAPHLSTGPQWIQSPVPHTQDYTRPQHGGGGVKPGLDGACFHRYSCFFFLEELSTKRIHCLSPLFSLSPPPRLLHCALPSLVSGMRDTQHHRHR